ncbi:MAG: MFS transporter [Ignavibacteriales bacterium]|nr:MFS transporter [Ignavibacteriales bacterium]
MGKIIFSVRYEIKPEKRNEYLETIHELKNIVFAEGLESYSVFEDKSKNGFFEEIYIFDNADSYEKFDDAENERVEILVNKLSSYIKENSTKYLTLSEV